MWAITAAKVPSCLEFAIRLLVCFHISFSRFFQHVPTIFGWSWRVTWSSTSECLCRSCSHTCLYCFVMSSAITGWTSHKVRLAIIKAKMRTSVKTNPTTVARFVSNWPLRVVLLCLWNSGISLSAYLVVNALPKVWRKIEDDCRRSNEQTSAPSSRHSNITKASFPMNNLKQSIIRRKSSRALEKVAQTPLLKCKCI